MRVSKSNKYPSFLGWLIALLWLSTFSVYGAGFSAEVKQAEMKLQREDYLFSAVLVYHLSDKAKNALQNGVPLFWNVHFKLQQPHFMFLKSTLIDVVIRYRIQYHALLNMYRVRNEFNGEVYNFSTLPAALELMSVINDLDIIKKTDLDAKKTYFFYVKVDFDRDALPLPLRPIAYIDPQWYLSSDWTLWPLKK